MDGETNDTIVQEGSRSFFYNSPAFVFRYPDVKIVSFPSGEKDHLASIYFTIDSQRLISVDKSPFGGFILDTAATKADVEEVLRNVIEWSEVNNVETITVRCFPEIYAPHESELINAVLETRGFKIMYRDVSQYIAVHRGQDLGLNVHRKRRLKKCVSEGFVFQQVLKDSLEGAYQLFVESRASKGYPVTMTLTELSEMFDRFPEQYLLFVVWDGSQMIAASVCIKVNQRILHCFYLGDKLTYRKYSPITMLIKGIYDFCDDHGFKLIDLGISTEEGVMNQGLFSFKASLGSELSNKLTFERKR